MNKLLLIILALLLITPLVCATQQGLVGQNTTVYITTTATTTTGNISVFRQDGTLLIANATLTLVSQNNYRYTFMPNATGNYLLVPRMANGVTPVTVDAQVLSVVSPELVPEMLGLTTIIALGIVTAIMVFVAFKIKDEHAFLTLLLLTFSFVMLLLIAASAAEHNEACTFVMNSATPTLSCVDSASTTETWFFRIVMWMLIGFFMYVLIWLFYSVISRLREAGKI